MRTARLSFYGGQYWINLIGSISIQIRFYLYRRALWTFVDKVVSTSQPHEVFITNKGCHIPGTLIHRFPPLFLTFPTARCISIKRFLHQVRTRFITRRVALSMTPLVGVSFFFGSMTLLEGKGLAEAQDRIRMVCVMSIFI